MTKLKRFFVIFVTMLCSFLLQVVFLPMIPHLIVVPNLLLVSVLTFGFLYGKTAGLLTGMAAGLCLDIFASGVFGFYLLIFSVIGYIDGILFEKMESELILVLFLLVIGNEAVYHAYEYIFAFLLHTSFHFGSYVLSVFLPETLLTSVCFVPVYGVLLFLNKKWNLKVNKGDVRIV